MSENETFDGVKTRLDEIVEAVSQEDVSLDEALALYEEAVGLGLKACDLSESGLKAVVEDEVDDQPLETSGADSVSVQGFSEQSADAAQTENVLDSAATF